VIEIPVAFGVYPYENSSNAYAFTTDHVNALVDGNTIVTGAAYGPKVDWDKNGSKTDILKDYVKSAYGKVFSNVVFADARGYHNGIGSLHCATNVQREIPTEKWWEMSSQTPSVASTVL